MSTHGLQWYGWGDCLTTASLDALASEWGADILRVSMYVQEDGYETDPAGYRQMIDTLVDETRARGLYCLLDWHILTPGDPWDNIDLAREYFEYMAGTHGGKGHVLYEICNEPNGDAVDWARIKSYAEDLIPRIRARDPEGIIIVGTPHWSSLGLSGPNPGDIVGGRLTGDNGHNVMYAFHFYAASHQQYAEFEAFADQLPLFVTEWGSQEYTGDGPNDIPSAQTWLGILADRKISWCNWNLSDDERSGAVWEPGTCPGGPWTGGSLKESGRLLMDWLVNPPDDF
jgi:endoglucanase